MFNPYEKKYFPKSILKGLEFYYELLDKVNIEVYLKKDFPIKRKDILITISFLKSISDDDKINGLCMSHPLLTNAIESIESYSSISEGELSYSEMTILYYLNELLSTGSDIMFLKAKEDIPLLIKIYPLKKR